MRILMVGAGMVGLCAGMLLADDGHDVTVVERDPAPPPDSGQAWSGWERRGVNQFRLPNFLLTRFPPTAGGGRAGGGGGEPRPPCRTPSPAASASRPGPSCRASPKPSPMPGPAG